MQTLASSDSMIRDNDSTRVTSRNDIMKTLLESQSMTRY